MERNMGRCVDRLPEWNTSSKWVIDSVTHQERGLLAKLVPDYVVRFRSRSTGKEGIVVVELDGYQHFHPVRKYGWLAGLAETQARDKLKEELCVQRGIHLLRMDHTVNRGDYIYLLTEFLDRAVEKACVVWKVGKEFHPGQ